MTKRPGKQSVAFVSERMLRGFGVDLVVDEVASRLSGRGYDVTVYASVVDATVSRNYRLRTIPTRASGLPARYQGAARWWAEYIDAFHHDLVFIESYPYYSLIPRLRTPVVAVDHGVSSAHGMPLKQRLTFRSIKNAQQGRYFPRAAGIIAVSEYIRSLLPSKLRAKTRVIYNGADHYPAPPLVERQAMRARLGIEDGQVMMLYVGRLNPEGQPYKGTADLMQAALAWAESEPNIRLLMAGTGSDADAKRIRDAGAIPLLNVPHEEMAALHAAADIYVTASRWEGFDLPLVEAAAQGVPSIALRIGAHPEVVRDGETGVLVDNVSQLVEMGRQLARDPSLRRTLGDAARAWAGNFTWSRATDAYEETIKELVVVHTGIAVEVSAGAQRQGAARDTVLAGHGERPAPDVTAVILNYGAEYSVLRKCVASLTTQTYPVKTVLVDNGSPKNQDAVAQAKLEFPEIDILQLDKNYGFAGGINRGVDTVTTPYVLLVNNDAALAPDAIKEMRALIEDREDVAGIAPKILLEEPAGYIDAIGNLVDPIGQAFNMGIGQLDIGQYDRVEATFGACFAATLLRRELWQEGLVGPLDEQYFMYYEDVDWCFRAGILGYKFLTCPTAVVEHAHSLSTRQLNYGYKYRMIMRNFVRTVIKDFQGRSWMRIAVRRCLGLTRNVLRGPHRAASFLALKDIALSFPAYYRKRRTIQGRRKTADGNLFNYSHGEQGFFDPTGYAPVRRLETLAFMYNRLYLLHGKPHHREIAATASALTGSRMRFDREYVRWRLESLVEGEPENVRRYVEAVEI